MNTAPLATRFLERQGIGLFGGVPAVSPVDEFDGDDEGYGGAELGDAVFGLAVGVAA